MFKVTKGRGFHLPLPNGYVVSIQIGPGDYCDNYDEPFECDALRSWTSTTAETAILNPEGNLIEYPKGEDTVQGYQTPEQVLATITYAASLANA